MSSNSKCNTFGFDDAGCLAVYVEEVIRETVPTHEGKISEDHALSGMNIGAFIVLHSPACLLQRLIAVLARLIFRGGHATQNTRFAARNHHAFQGLKAVGLVCGSKRDLL